jgi:hypothetical protein
MTGWMPAQPRIYKYTVHTYIVRTVNGRWCNPVDAIYTNGWRVRSWVPIQYGFGAA